MNISKINKSYFFVFSLLVIQIIFFWGFYSKLSLFINNDNTVDFSAPTDPSWTSAPTLMKVSLYPHITPAPQLLNNKSSLFIKAAPITINVNTSSTAKTAAKNATATPKPVSKQQLQNSMLASFVDHIRKNNFNIAKCGVHAAGTFQTRVIDPVLMKINLYSKSASNLLLGTAIQESSLGKLSKNVFQIQLETVRDLNSRYLVSHPSLNKVVHQLYNPQHSVNWNLNNNVEYEIAIARIIYLRGNQQLPHASNIDGLARFWKKYYNTYLGKGTPYQFKSHFYDYVSEI